MILRTVNIVLLIITMIKLVIFEKHKKSYGSFKKVYEDGDEESSKKFKECDMVLLNNSD